MPAAPKVFRILTDYWGVSRALQQVWWQALSAATWSQAVQWRSMLLFYGAPMLAPRQLLFRVCAPGEVLEVLEVLVKEGRLERRTATTIEESIMSYVNKQGGWYGGQQGAGTT